jgi:dienelactone hydrolase
MEKDKSYAVVREELEVKKESGHVIRGLIFRPDSDGKFPTVIFSHGFGGNYRGLAQHGDDFAKSGIVCVFFDFCGGGMESSSDGNMSEMTVMTEANDLVAVMESINCLSYVEPESIYLLGESQGGFVSAIVGRAYRENVKGLILWYPAFVIPDDARKRLESGIDSHFGLKLSEDYDKVAQDIDVQELQLGFGKPVLILHGNKDDAVPIEYSRTAAANYSYATLKEIKGAGHGFNDKDGEFARSASIDFVRIYEGVSDLKFDK